MTGGDATKAKQLTDLLYMRVHAGEQRRLNATEKEVCQICVFTSAGKAQAQPARTTRTEPFLT